MFNFKKEMGKRIVKLERELTDCNIWVNSIRIELTNLQITVKKIKDITGYDSYEYKTELVKKKIKPKSMTATEAMGQRDPEDLVPEPGQTVKFKK